MTRCTPDLPDASACPLLGLADDPRTRFTFPHPGHRCHARRSPRGIEPIRQSTHCLSLNFTACDRYEAWLRREGVGRQPDSRRPAQGPSSRQASTIISAAAPATTVIHVFRAGDSLARIAAAYGLIVEEIVAANHLTFPEAVVEGQRLVIPVGLSAASSPDPADPNRGWIGAVDNATGRGR